MPIPQSSPEQPPAGLYLHVPFCVRRCLYCDFYVLPLGDGPPSKRLREFRNLKHRRFLRALDHELASLPSGFRPRTVYIGGGTPTELSPPALRHLFESIHRHIDLSRITEFGIEANPGTLDAEMADLLASQGVTRVSLGVQSFIDPVLETLGRIHNRADAVNGVQLLRTAGIRNLSLDLLFGLPRSGPQDIQVNLDCIRELNPEHVSWYSLEFEPGTSFTDMRDRGFLPEPEEEAVADEYTRIREGLDGQDYHQYELFSFTRPGFACAHNLNYWRGGGYYGCGPSAHSHLDGTRWSNLPDLTAYVRYHCDQQGNCRSESETLSPIHQARETLMISLRQTDGISESDFVRQSGYTLHDLLGPSLRLWQEMGWVEHRSGRLKLLPPAYLISDSLFREFL
jgi:oxygen-independent coproporphyrinogen-3 oxidase